MTSSLLLADPATMSRDQITAGLLHTERMHALLDSWQVAACEELRRRESAESADDKRYVADEVAAELRWGEGHALDRFTVGQALAERFPQLQAALREGDVSFAHVRAIVELIPDTLDDAAAARVATEAMYYAELHTVADLRRKVRRDVARADPEAFAAAVEQNTADRRVWALGTVPGMARFGADLPVTGCAELMAALDAIAARAAGPDDVRTAAQRRADALTGMARDVLAGGCSHCGLPARPNGPAVQVSVALSTLLGFDEQAAELDGQPIPAGLARALAGDENGTWRRLLTDAEGQLLEYGRATYRPPSNLRDFVTARHRRCVFPGCARRSAGCEVDHVRPWQHGGRTDAANLVPLCSRHHHLKHEAAGWQVRLLPHGDVEWTSPSGRVRLVPPDNHPLDTTVVGPADNGHDADAWLAELTVTVPAVVGSTDNGIETGSTVDGGTADEAPF